MLLAGGTAASEAPSILTPSCGAARPSDSEAQQQHNGGAGPENCLFHLVLQGSSRAVAASGINLLVIPIKYKEQRRTPLRALHVLQLKRSCMS